MQSIEHFLNLNTTLVKNLGVAVELAIVALIVIIVVGSFLLMIQEIRGAA
jgi:hypothetical protein